MLYWISIAWLVILQMKNIQYILNMHNDYSTDLILKSGMGLLYTLLVTHAYSGDE